MEEKKDKIRVELDVEALALKVGYYPPERVKEITKKLFQAGESVMGEQAEEPGETICAMARGDQTPIAQLATLDGNVNLAAGVLTIGRSSSCDICIENDMQVSRMHASLTIHHSDGRMTLRDLKSGNGTYVNNRRILEVRVSADDEIQIGQTILVLKGVLKALPKPNESES